jgi:hypothetical protein
MIRRMGRPGLIGLAARTAVVAGTASAVSGGMRANQQSREQQAAEAQQFEAQQQQQAMDAAAQRAVAAQQAPAAAPPAAANDLMGQITQLAGLHSQGILSDEEFTAAKAKLLA